MKLLQRFEPLQNEIELRGQNRFDHVIEEPNADRLDRRFQRTKSGNKNYRTFFTKFLKQIQTGFFSFKIDVASGAKFCLNCSHPRRGMQDRAKRKTLAVDFHDEEDPVKAFAHKNRYLSGRISHGIPNGFRLRP